MERLAAYLVGAFTLVVLCSGCAVVTVAGAAVSAAGAVVSVGATAVEATADVMAAGVRAATGSGDDSGKPK